MSPRLQNPGTSPSKMRGRRQIFVALALLVAACGREDERFEAWTSCGMSDIGDDAPGECMCRGVERCDAVVGGNWLGLGSESFRVCGIESGDCVIAAFGEIEGGGAASTCRIPLGLDVCSGVLTLEDLDGYCESRFGCNLLMESCPADLLGCPP